MMQNKRTIKIPPPPFMQGGKVVEDGITRNAVGYPLDADGNVDVEATKRECMRYFTRISGAKFSYKKTNEQPAKKKRK